MGRELTKSLSSLTVELKEAVLAAGIDLVGVTSAEPLPVCSRVYKHSQPRELLAEARAVVVAGFCVSYEPSIMPSEAGRPRGHFAPYGSRAFLQMEKYCRDIIGGFLRGRGYLAVAAPGIPVKPAASRAGLGGYGKNGVIITPELGSWVMFDCIVTDAQLAGENSYINKTTCPDSCDRCLKACPTGAITAPYQVDYAKCITGWLWGAFVPPELRSKQETRLFGCGECLLACPQNAEIPPRRDYPIPIDGVPDSPELIPLLTADEKYFRRVIPSFAMQAGINSIRGNAVIALGNLGDPSALEVLTLTLQDKNAQIRAYTAWTLGRIGVPEVEDILRSTLVREKEPTVVEEIKMVLEDIKKRR